MKKKLKKTAEVIFGNNERVPVARQGFRTKTIPAEAREVHSVTTGASGVGKSHLLMHRIMTAIERDEGVGVIDAKGDLYTYLLKAIYDKIRNGKKLANKLVLFDPTASRLPGFNPIEVKSSDPEEHYQTALSILQVFKDIWGETFYGPRLADILKNSILLLQEHDEAITMIPRLLTDEDYRRYMVSSLQNRQTKEFWEHRFENLPEREKRTWVESTLNKVSEFLSPNVRNIVGHRKSSIDLRDIIDNGKILLVNLPKGKLGQNSYLLGALLVARLNRAAISRCSLPEEKRRLFHLFIDEAQSICTENTRTILSESRSSGLSIHVASQDLAGFSRDLRSSILANCKLIFSFRVSREDADVLGKVLSCASGEEVKFQLREDLLGQPESNPIYRSITEEHERMANRLVNLAPRELYFKVRGNSREPSLLRTIDTPEYNVDQKILEKFTLNVMKPYTKDKQVIEKEMENHLDEVDKKVEQAILNGKI
ncbi:type IV secretory system conjugative DNA transfer family protein [Candidatus Bipolaricaulota bacterium]|nr:type IV secretory system conjugative DNA transfer family protein [Candidatus Bipolaricaulota bacterium]